MTVSQCCKCLCSKKNDSSTSLFGCGFLQSESDLWVNLPAIIWTSFPNKRWTLLIVALSFGTAAPRQPHGFPKNLLYKVFFLMSHLLLQRTELLSSHLHRVCNSEPVRSLLLISQIGRVIQLSLPLLQNTYVTPPPPTRICASMCL